MPQMSPIMWTTLMMIYTFAIHQMNTSMKFEQTPKKKKKKKKKKKIKIKW